jgi:glycosyltransferase involved in cell wall biosynthesis
VKVLYDVGVFGQSKVHVSSRTGIFRTVYELGLHLLHHPDVSCLSLFAAEPELETLTHLFLQELQAEEPGSLFLNTLFYSQQGQLGLTGQANGLISQYKARVERAFCEAKQQRMLWKQNQWTQKPTTAFSAFSFTGAVYQRFNNEACLQVLRSLRKHWPFTVQPGYVFKHPVPANVCHITFSQYINTRYRLPKALPRVVTVYDLTPIVCEAFARANPHLRTLHEATLKHLVPEDVVVCISESCRSDLLNYLPRLKPERVLVTPLAASQALQPVTCKEAVNQVLQAYGVPTQQPYFLTVCTLAPHKNLATVVRAFVAFLQANNNPEVNLVLTGPPGWAYTEIYEAIALNPKLKQRFYFPGFVPNSVLPALYSGALGFVYASLYEGFGLPVLEAMQCGVAVICSNTSSLPEVAGQAALQVTPTDEAALSEAMQRLFTQPGLSKTLQAQGVQQARLFSWQRCAQQTVNAYHLAMANP